MPNYLVRVRENGEAVGLFAVKDLDDLRFWVEDVTDPANCEYAEIGSGSVVWEGAAMRLPAPDYEWDTERRPLLDVIGKHSIGGNWLNALFSEHLEFKPCVGDAPANDP